MTRLLRGEAHPDKCGTCGAGDVRPSPCEPWCARVAAVLPTWRPDIGDGAHGSNQRYNGGCRCEPCRAANARAGGGVMPSDKYVTATVGMLDLHTVREILRALSAENQRLRAALEQARDYCARPAGVCFDPTLLDGSEPTP